MLFPRDRKKKLVHPPRDSGIEGSVKHRQRGQTSVLFFGIVTKGDIKAATTDPIIVNDLVLTKFTFEHLRNQAHKFQLEPRIWLKKIANTKSSTIKIKLSYGKFVKELICPDNFSEIKLEPKLCDFHITDSVISFLKVKIILLETKATSLQKQIFYDDEELIDFYLCAPDGKVGIQKAFLGLYSEVFMMMLKREWKETLEGEISIVGVTKQTLQDLKQYVYLGTLPDEGLEPLLVVASRYMMDELKDECIAKLSITATPEKLDDLVEFACLHNLPDLIRAVLYEVTDSSVQGLYELKMKKKLLMTSSTP